MTTSRTLGGAACLCALMLVACSLVACSGDNGKGGADGVNGMDGHDGLPGADGQPGKDGTDGKDGTNGTNGTNGLNGADGADGDAGVDGQDGLDGLDGDDGDDGAMGLMGTMGDKGDKGDAGAMGEMGLPGTSGIIDRTMLAGDFVSYDCMEQSSSGITGTVRLAKFVNGSTLVTIKLDPANLTSGLRRAHIHTGSLVGGGGPIITLNHVDDLTGMSETVVTQLNDGTPVTYDELLTYDAYINVHQVLPAGAAVCGSDIGRNTFTGDEITYDLPEANASGYTGTVRLQERADSTTLVTVEVTGPALGTDRNAHFHPGSVAVPVVAAPLKTLTTVSATTNRSYTEVDALNDLTPITYDELLVIDAYVNVHTADGTGSICSGDVGIND